MSEKFALQAVSDKPDTVKEVIRRYEKLVRNIILRRIQDPVVVDDLVKETFLRYSQIARRPSAKHPSSKYRKLMGMGPRSISTSALLTQIAKKVAADHLQKVERSAETLMSAGAASEGESNAEPHTVVTQEVLNEEVDLMVEDVKLYEQSQAMLAEVDEIIERLERDREEINRLKEETRSNISELQRMIAA